MSASGEAASDLTDKFKEVEVTDSPCQDHGDAPSDFERSTKTLMDLEEKLRELQEMQLATTEKNNALQEEIRQLHEKREADKQKYKTLFLGHEKYARMRAEYKEMSKFIKAHKEEVEAAKAKMEQQEAPQPESQPQSQPPPAPPPPPQQESPPQQTVEPVAIKRHAIRGEPCLTLTRSEVCRLEQDVLGLRDLLSRREESWRRAKARELEARKKIASLSTELATVRQLAQMRRNQSDELAHRLQEALLELKKHKVENDKLRNNVVRLRNRERSLLTTLTKKCKKSSAKAEHKKGRQQRKKSAKSSLQPESVISSPRGETSPRGILRVQCSPPTRT
ncbi:MAP7 domain-containing protein 1-like [Schistocerca gregaria]|uniref:MAP7 domain-containing protein 1-like n=1 Tax=Schistocerca gregaria TaxID=7010 RepID=UPI00211E2BCE|nr:MAP7 domain-containing protein 1-like [Schistocerca gregaria]